MKPKRRVPPTPPPKLDSDDYDDLINGLELTPETVSKEIERLPLQFMQAAQLRTHTMARAARAAATEKQARSDADLKTRQRKQSSGDKLTEGEVKARIESDPTVVAATEEAIVREEAAELAKLLVDAYRVKRDCARMLVDMTSAERSIQAAHREATRDLSAARDRVREKYRERGA